MRRRPAPTGPGADRRQVAAGVIVALAAACWVVTYRALWGQDQPNALLAVYVAVAAVLVTTLWAASTGRRHTGRPAHGGPSRSS